MPKKIYELANEWGVGALDLVEELKSYGFNVRNHMASLSDEEIQKAMELRSGPEEKKEPEKKKKVTKKKAVKKAEVAPAAGAVEVSEKSTEEVAVTSDGTRKKVATKRKTGIIRRKASDLKEGAEEVAAATALREEAEEPEIQVQEERVEREREVSVPSATQQETVETSEKSSTKEYLDDKLHTFTPVFIPKAEEAKTTDRPQVAKTPTEGGVEGVEDEVELSEDDEKNKESKKRLGGLAKMVAKPKAAAKVRDLTLMRAEEELKSYGVLLGKTLYTPAKRKKVYSGPVQKTEITEVKESKRVVTIHGAVQAKELAHKLGLKFQDLRDKALDLNLLLHEEDYLGAKLATEISSLYNYRVENRAFNESAILEESVPDKSLAPRNPIITIMGHVDHGKTTLLDYIRKAKVAQGEAGGITQHIGAYSVKVNEATLTFLDTPGHAAFAAMRERGAKVTDIVVLVVAADDGVMPQTKESIRFCQQAGVPIIVAVNKMDKEGVNPDRVKQELMEFNITPEEWGGDTQFVEISALKGMGVDRLLESIKIQAEMMELRADPKGKARGTVIESEIESGRGPVATLLIQEGTLHKGDAIVVGETFGRARSLMDSTGTMLNSAGPSTPVQVLGLEAAPSPGDIFNVVKNEREAKRIIDNRVQEKKELQMANKRKMSLEDFFSTATQSTDRKILKLIVRTDVLGSYEAIKASVEALGNSEVGVEVIGGGVGAISDSDVQLAASSSGYIIGFNMRPVTSARRLAEDKGVDIKNYSIIYELINDIKLALEGMLTPETVEVYIGRAEVRNVFNVPKIGAIAGSAVIDGKIQRGCNIRLLRNGKIVFDGKLASLKRFKDDAKEVSTGYECGIALENFNDIKVEDIFEAYQIEERKRTLQHAEAHAT